MKIGTVDYHTAVRSTVKDMAKSGLRRVTFDSGYSRRLDSQARMNILEGVRRLNGEMMEETGRRFGADGVEISAHALCAPDHIDIQGRQYRKAEWDRINSGLKRPIGTLNCHHYTTPIIYGVSRPVYSEKELSEINRRSSETVEWKGREMTRYEASQKQRQLETAIRYAKDERNAMTAAGDKRGAAQARTKSAALGREYKAFCEKTGLTPRYERTRAMTGTIVGASPKILEKTAESGTMELPPFIVGKGLGAAAKNYSVIDKRTGLAYHFVEGTRIRNPKVFAGYNGVKPLNQEVVEGLVKEFGGSESKWQHAKGIGILDVGGEEIEAEVHWFQEPTVGKVKFKVKRWLYD